MPYVRKNSSWKITRRRIGGILAASALTVAFSNADERNRDILVLTSTNATTNQLVVFKLADTATPSLNLVNIVATGGVGGAGGNAGAVQFQNGFGAVANYGSSTVTQIARDHNFIRIARTIKLAQGCTNPVSVALAPKELFVAGANCAESHNWPSGSLNGSVVALLDNSAAQIAVGETWAAVTLKSGNGSVVQVPLANDGGLAGKSSRVALTLGAGATPLGAAFWGDILGFNPAHVPDSFALLDKAGAVTGIPGPAPAFPDNAPCWLAKGQGNIWYSANSPGQAITIFFSDGQNGVFYKSVPLPGVPSDITVSPDNKWLAVIYTATSDGLARIAVFAVDSYGDLTLAATSGPVGTVTAFNGVAISE
jgi:hypothetical protein